MDFRQLIDKLDSLNEDDLAAAQDQNQKKWDFAEKKAHLFGLLQQLRSLSNTAPQGGTTTPAAPPTKWSQDVAAQKGLHTDIRKLSKTEPDARYAASSIKESLVSSFGYQLDEADAATATLNAAAKEAGLISKIGGKLAFPLSLATYVWDAYQQITALPSDMPEDEYRAEVTKIIGKGIADYGVFAVGAGLGAAVGGAVGGPAALVTGIAGGILADYNFGDDADKLVDWIVDTLYAKKDQSKQQEPQAEVEVNNDSLMSDVTREVQSRLKMAGFSLGKHDVDGKFGPDTIAALQAFKEKTKASSDIDALLKLVNIESPVAESISSVDDLSILKSKLDEISRPNWLKFRKAPPAPTKAKAAKAPKGSTYVNEKGIHYEKYSDGKWYVGSDQGPIRITDKGIIANLEKRAQAPGAAPAAPTASVTPAPANTPGAKTASSIAAKVPNAKTAFQSLSKFGGMLKTAWSSTKFVALIGALAAAGYYLWNNQGNLTTNSGETTPDAGGGASTTAPATGPTPVPAQEPAQQPAQNRQLTDLVSQIKLDISQLKMFNDPSIKADADKAIQHAEKTLQLYAPGY